MTLMGNQVKTTRQRENKKQANYCLVSVSHEVAGMCVCSCLQGEGWLMNHYVPLRGCGPQGLSGWGTCDPSTLAATVRQQGQLTTQDSPRDNRECDQRWVLASKYKY